MVKLFWGLGFFGLGIILSVVGAMLGALIAQIHIPPYQRGRTGPSARPAGVRAPGEQLTWTTVVGAASCLVGLAVMRAR